MPGISFENAAAEMPPFSIGISTASPLRLSVIVTVSGTSVGPPREGVSPSYRPTILLMDPQNATPPPDGTSRGGAAGIIGRENRDKEAPMAIVPDAKNWT